jgi:hypothetical protein
MKEAMKAGALRATKAVDLERNGLRVGRGHSVIETYVSKLRLCQGRC